MTVDESVQSQTIRPAGGEVNDINLWIITSWLSDPAQEYLFTVGLLQSSHDIFHYIFDLRVERYFHKEMHEQEAHKLKPECSNLQLINTGSVVMTDLHWSGNPPIMNGIHLRNAWPVMSTEIHSLLDDRAKVSFLPASRKKRQLVLLEQKNLGRIILDKVPVMNRGTKCRQKRLGPGRLALWWFPS